MSKWIVMFDRLGLDMLVPCDVMNKDILQWLGGQKFSNEIGRQFAMAKMRAQANPQRFPEIWTYDLEQDMSYEDMRALWEASPQHMADLVRKKGGCLYKTPRERDLIV